MDVGGAKKKLTGELGRFVKFGLTGVMNTLVDFLIFMLLISAGLHIYPSQAISYSCGMLNSYIVNRRWTFESKGKFLGGQLLRFFAANMAMLLLSLLLLAIFTSWLNFGKLVAKIFSTAIIMILGFVINRLWVFRGK